MCGHRGKAQANAGEILVPLGTGKENAAERSAMGPDKDQKVFDRHETSDPAVRLRGFAVSSSICSFTRIAI